ncbi:MAG: polysaccharide deacetylase family protein [Bacteroidia bacterium]
MNKTELHKLLNLEVNSGSPTFIIYSEKSSTRLAYVSKFIFEHVLKVNVSVTDSVSEFENSSFFKINYSEKTIGNTFRIAPNGLLFETGVSEKRPKTVLKDQIVYFFENVNSIVLSGLDYDVFSAAFYFISRYEEWQSFEKDVHGRFEAKASILFQNNLHLKPVVDIWIQELKQALKKTYPAIKFPENKFKVISTIDVDNLYAYKEKGFLRTVGAMCKDVLKGDVNNLNRRTRVLKNKENDPFDIYSSVSEFCADKKIPLIYFFLFRTGNKYDRTVDPGSKAFIEVFERIKKRAAFVGLHPSYYSSTNKDLLKEEVNNFSDQSKETVKLSRQHYLRFDIKTTPLLLIENGIAADFTMGFASDVGFRAGTSFPFYYYDLGSEQQKDLLFVPFCVMDGAYFVYDKADPNKMLKSISDLVKEVKKVNGLFISVFHERTFAYHLYPGYDRIYNYLHQHINEL